MRKLKRLILASGVALALGTVSAQGAPISSLLVGGPNAASDENREYIIDRNLGVGGALAGQLDVGDSLRGFLNINTLNSPGANVGGVTGNNELTGVFQALVVGKVDLGAGAFSFIFAPDPAFALSICGGTVGCASAFVPGPGALAVLFEDASPNAALSWNDLAPAAVPDFPVGPGQADDGGALAGTLSPPVGTRDDDVSTAATLAEEAFGATLIDGMHYWTLGFTGVPGSGEGWSAVSVVGDNIIFAFSLTSAATGVLYNAGLSCLAAGPGAPACTDVLPLTAGFFGPVQFGLTGSVRGVGDLDTPFEASSDVTVAFNLIPEPGTLALLGFALAVLGFVSRRRKQ